MAKITGEEALRLENQLCFPLYAASRLVTQMYRPALDPLGLTYTQYIALMALWEHESMTIGELCARLKLNTGTVTPVAQRLEKLGYARRTRGRDDERVVRVQLTTAGEELKQKCLAIPVQMAGEMKFSMEKAKQLKLLLEELLASYEAN